MSDFSFRGVASLTVLALSFGLAATSGAQQQQGPDLLSLWLAHDCEVGEQGVLEAQIAQAGTQLVPGLIEAAQNGLDSSMVSQIQLKAGQEFDGLAAFLAGGGGADVGLSTGDIQDLESLSRDDFIAEEVKNATLSYQSHALVGLGIVGGPTALQVLQSFANDTGSPLQPIAQQALANFAGATTMAGNITAKAGPLNARVWTLTLTDNGPGAAMGVQVNSVNLTQTFGAACTPVVTTPAAFPLSVGSIAPAGSESTAITINFTSCPANARFTANISFSANSGTVTGTVIRYNQFE
jgi:hypothetical protein